MDAVTRSGLIVLDGPDAAASEGGGQPQISASTLQIMMRPRRCRASAHYTSWSNLHLLA